MCRKRKRNGITANWINDYTKRRKAHASQKRSVGCSRVSELVTGFTLVAGREGHADTRRGTGRPFGSGYDIGADEWSLCHHPLTGVHISGPTGGYTDTVYVFTATIAPADATAPVAYTWTPTPTAGSGAVVTYTWTTTGPHAITVVAQNCGRAVRAQRVVYLFPRGAALDIGKSVTPDGLAFYGDELLYTLFITGTQGSTVNLYDPLSVTTFLRFVTPVAGIEHHNGIITGSLLLTPTVPLTVSFVARVGVPGTVGWTVDVNNRACVYPAGGTVSDCIWSNVVTNAAAYPRKIYLPLVLRGR